MRAAGDAGGYAWSGSLDASGTDVRALFARCAELRLSGLLELTDGPKSAMVSFVGGEAVQSVGEDTAQVKTWTSGKFRLLQCVPDLAGSLTGGIRLSGSLHDARPRDLIRHCEDTRLTADLELQREGGEQARLRFAHGRVESSEVNGRPELGALVRVSSWMDGKYSIVLRPLFGADAPKPLPPTAPARSTPDPAQLFDLTRPVELPEARQEVRHEVRHEARQEVRHEPRHEPRHEARHEPRQESRHERKTSPMAVPVVPAATPTPVIEPDSPRDDERTSPQPRVTLGMDMDSEGTSMVAPLPPPPPNADRTASVRLPGSRRRTFILAGALLGAIIVTAALLLGNRGAPGSGAAPQPAPIVEKRAPAPPPGAPDERPAPAEDPIDHERVAGLVARGRKAMIQGKKKAALESFRAAQKISPADALSSELVLMAEGKTGSGTLFLIGKGSVDIDGQRFRSPRKVKVPAGPHHVRGEELRVDRGELIKVRAR